MIKDSHGIAIQPGDRIMITAWGSNVTLASVRQTGIVTSLASKRPVIGWDNPSQAPQRGNVRPEMLSVLRRDGGQGFEGNVEAPVCEWFAKCDHPAVGVIAHPVLGDVPCCQRCADKLEMTNRLRAF